ncbi:uncharacterized protein LOC135845265 isoform X2 [Planococcus citri]|uniref:uncharacterized protein LOC135845265 isoform X2 n=1 Tax=Planococcus citri TaxID=170843 RepID=UPI0031F91480
MIFEQTSIKFVVFQILVGVTYTKRYHCEAKTEELRSRLFSNYNLSISSNTISQDYLQKFDFRTFYADIDASGIFQLIGDAKAIWKDDQLSWYPNEYNNTHSLDIGDYFHQIWKPDFILINNAFRNNKSLLDSEDYIATVWHNGTVMFWTRYISIQVGCQITIKSRPWVNQMCQLYFETSSSKFLFTVHSTNTNESTSMQFLENTTWVNSNIKSPWMVNKTRKVASIDGNHTLSNNLTLIEVELHRNMGPYKSTQCISYPSSYKDEIHCYLFSNFNLLLPPSEVESPRMDSDIPSIILRISYIDFNIESGMFLLIGEVAMDWYNEQVRWHNTRFGGQLYLDVSPDSVWKPSLILNNNMFRKNYFNKNTFGGGHLVEIQWSGRMRWRTSMYAHTKCHPSSNSWPWGSQTCNLNFTTNVDGMDPFVFQAHDPELHEVTSLWTITNVKIERNFPILNIEVTFEINSRSSQIVSCLAFIGVSLVMLASFLISPGNRIKQASKMVSLLFLAMYLVMLMNSIPHFTEIQSNFLIGFVLLLSIVGISGCVSATIVRFARKSRLYHPSLIMVNEQEDRNLEENMCENYRMNTVLPDNIPSTDDQYNTPVSLMKKSQTEWLKIHRIVEYLSFSACLMVVVILTLSFTI